MNRLCFALLPAPLLLLAACAESAKSAAAPSAPSGGEAVERPGPAATAVPVIGREETTTLLDAQVEAVAAAEGQIDQVLGDAAKKQKDDAHARGLEAPPKAGVPRGPAPQKPVPVDAGNVGATCSLACSALASMNRAVAHLCLLAGETDRRCEDGRSRERSATQRVHASCPSCSS